LKKFLKKKKKAISKMEPRFVEIAKTVLLTRNHYGCTLSCCYLCIF